VTNFRPKFALMLLSLLSCRTVDAAGERARLIAPAELEKRLGEGNLRILDVRPKEDYDKGHIPGAVRVDPDAVEALAARRGALTDRAAWEAWIEPLGIGPASEVFVSDGERQLDAARIWWLLSYIGVEKVGLIDGNFPLWARQGRPVATDVPEIKPCPFRVAFRPERYAPRSEVLDSLRAGKARIVDARSTDEYTGTEKRARKGGHIPTACHLEWSKLVDKDGRFLDEPALRATLAKIGIQPGEPVITHCQGGGRSSVDAFVLERLGFPARNYYESWADWGNAPETPIAVGDKPGEKP
jgi:thiosulfate/3-mercaptopyruvate sulfurtransferase